MRRATRSGTRVDTVLFTGCVALSLVLRVVADPVRDSIGAALRQTVVAPLIHLQSVAEQSHRAFATHEERSAARDSALLLVAQFPAVSAENSELRRSLALGSRLGWGFISANAIRGRSNGWQTTITLTAGSEEGVERLSAVVAADGLVGVVHAVDAHFSVASLWTDPTFSVSAMTMDRTAFGIISPHLGSGVDRFLLEFRNVPYRFSLEPGTPIVAAGVGGVFPAMVPIGTVISELETAAGWTKTYLVRPAVLPHDVGAVMILSPERSTAGVAGVWSTPAARDSIRREIVRIGDSLAASDRTTELRAARDSARAILLQAEARGDTLPYVSPPVEPVRGGD